MLAEGTIAPDFELPNQFGEPVRLSDACRRGPVVLAFFPLAFSARCTGELHVLNENLGLFRDRGVRLLALSVDSKFSLRAWREQEGYELDLLSDFWPHGAASSAYGAFLPERGHATRATFVIDASGVIRAAFHVAPAESRSIEAYRDALDSLPV